MIFITVGTQAPFDRLIRLMDVWALQNKVECFAQTYRSEYKPKNMAYKQMLNEKEFERMFEEADIIVGHAGMGTIISALQCSKLILTLPRLVEYKEHRDNHQLDTTVALSKKKYIYPIFNDNELIKHLNCRDQLEPLVSIESTANKVLIEFLQTL